MISLVDRILTIHQLLDKADVRHAFGGALALAYCTGEPRATRDIDINIFLPAEQVSVVQKALHSVIEFTDSQLRYLKAEGQTRVFWDETPVDLFFNVSDLHQHMSLKTSQGTLNGVEIPILSAEFLAIFKAMFNRTKDWADLEAMIEVGSFNSDFVVSQLVDLLGPQDPRIEQLSRLVAKS
ncbi:MAG: nucleotidyl transferase AbiEii/AbiGii toxin family protein [Actinomycetes bacterium]